MNDNDEHWFDPEAGSMLAMVGTNNGRIFDIKRCGNRWIIVEACDGYFDLEVTPDDLRRLGRELIDLADKPQ